MDIPVNSGDEMGEVIHDPDSDFELSDNEYYDESDSSSGSSQRPTATASTSEVVDDLSSWTTGPFVPIVHEFNDFISGVSPHTNLSDGSKEVDFFEHFLDKNVMDKIILETNNYYAEDVRRQAPTPKSRMHKWVNTNVAEMYVFFAISMLMTRNRHITIEEHWSTDPLLSSQIFGKAMPRDRYTLLLRMLHFSDPNTQILGDKLHKIRILIEHCREIFKKTMMPHENLCIDESIVVFKGRLLFKQYIPSKRHRFGIKMFVLCDVMTGYILDFIIYCGEGTDIVDEQGLGISGAVVTTLMKDYFGKGHTMWTDNWYSSPDLFKHLHDNITNACGTVRKNRKNMPKFRKLKKGEVESKNNSSLLAIKWHDRREVHMLTTLHNDSFAPTGKFNRQTGEPIQKPSCVIQYNKCMGSVDKADMMLSTLSCMRKSIKWYKKVAFHIIDLFLLNSYILFSTIKGKKTGLADFQLKVIRQIFEKYQVPTASRAQQPVDNPLRLSAKAIAKHMPDIIPPTNKRENPCRVCHLCANTKKKPKTKKYSRYMCSECNVPLCVYPCFRQYHEKANY